MTNSTTTPVNSAHPQGGPRTPEGKFESSKNALTHGLSAQSIDRFPAHLREEYKAFLATQYAEHKPVTLNECDHLEQYAFNRFQLSRAQPMLMQVMDELNADPANEALEKRYAKLNRHVKALERSARQALAEMRNFIADRMTRIEMLAHVSEEFVDQVDIPIAFPSHLLVERKQLRKPLVHVLERFHAEQRVRGGEVRP
jgi:hypothetical protein